MDDEPLELIRAVAGYCDGLRGDVVAASTASTTAAELSSPSPFHVYVFAF
jgi:hypothetical protein